MLCESGDYYLNLAKKNNWKKEVKLNGGRNLLITKNSVFDGELVVFDEKGVSHLEDYQNRSKHKLTYVIFDVLKWQGRDVTALSLLEREELLKKIKLPLTGLYMSRRGIIKKYNPEIKTIHDIPVWNVEKSKKLGVEGFVWKNPASKYEFRRSENWVKEKFAQIINMPILKFENTEKDGFVIYVIYNNVLNRVVVNSFEQQELIKKGQVKTAKIRFFDTSNKNGKLICPSYRGPA